MARDETDREDLLREATALVERIELVLTVAEPGAEAIVAGFRRDGALSVFFGADPVYQFNAAGELRRAYCDGLLYKAERGRLISLERVRTPNEVQLLRRDLSDEQQQKCLTQIGERLRTLSAELDRGTLRVIGQVPAIADVLGRVRKWLTEHDGLTIAKSPHATRT
jgi:hypothetical protein